MKINDINKLEQMTKNNKNFYWDGWNLVYIIQDDNGYMKKNGIFKNDSWHVTQTFDCVNGYWDIPDKIVDKLNV